MRTNTSLLKLLAAVFALTLLAAACGDDDDSSSSDTGSGTETGQEDTGGDTAMEDETGSDTGGDDTGGQASAADVFSNDCQQAIASFQGVQLQMGAAMSGQTAGFEEAKQQFDALAAAAPDEIADAFDTYATELGKLFDAMANIGLDEGGVPSADQIAQLSQLSESFDEQALEQASEEIGDYFDEICG